MFQHSMPAPATLRRGLVVVLSFLLPMTMIVLSPTLATALEAKADKALAAQTLNWTASGDITHYQSAPTVAVAGETVLVFENSAATGNDLGMPHTLTFDTSTEGYNHDVNVNLFASPFDPNGGRQTQTVTLTPGKYRYFCSIPGHSGMVGEFTVTDGGGGSDTTAPTVTGSVTGSQNADGAYLGAATVTVAATDAQSGVDTVEYQIDDTGFEPYTTPVRVTALGDHSVQFRATDKAGNTSAVGSVSFRVATPTDPADTTPPTVVADVDGEQDADGNYVGSATVKLAATDSGSGVARIEYALNDGPFATYTAPIVVNQTGMQMVRYRATDVAGNVSTEGMAHLTVVPPSPRDTTAPTTASSVAGDRDTAGAYLDSATVTVTATDTESGVATVQYSLDGAAFATYTAPVRVTALGAHTMRYRATDVAGNTSPDGTTSFTIVRRPVPDTTAPVASATVTGKRDASGNYVGSATVAVTATDAGSGVRAIEVAVPGGDWVVYSAPLAIRTPGPHTVRYRATDQAGNVSTEKTVTFTVVAADGDACPDSDSRATVIIGSDDTGIANVDTGNGCTINDLINERGSYANHASFVRHVDAVTDSLVIAGTLTARQQGTIFRAAARSDVGM
jgi:uncharacterized cupredoxin-like copper-binding protein